jgi:hypothetical protein
MGGTLALGVVMAFTAYAAGDREIATMFFISKTENRNQVHYAVKVDDACRPVRPAPVRPYWLMLEKGPRVVEPLLGREQAAFGIERQEVDGATVRIALRAIPSRGIVIQTWRAPDGACHSMAITSIAGVRARLFNLHLVLGMFGVAHVLLTGWRDDGTVVREQVNP